MMTDVFNRMLRAAEKGVTIRQQFTERYSDIVKPLKELGWNTNCMDFLYEYNNSLKLRVDSVRDGFELSIYK